MWVLYFGEIHFNLSAEADILNPFTYYTQRRVMGQITYLKSPIKIIYALPFYYYFSLHC